MFNVLRVPTLIVLLAGWLVSGQAATLHRGLGPEPDALDLHLAQSLAALNVLRDLHEGLITLDADGRLIAGVARSWTTSDDGRSWTFEIDPAARWSDGSAITADDFVAGWQRALRPETAAPMAGLLDPVAGASAVRQGLAKVDTLGIRSDGPDRLVVELDRPTPWFAELLTHPLTYPWPGQDSGRYSGPFVLVERIPGARIRLRANPRFRRADAVALDEVVWHVIEEPSVELARYRAGQLHITETIPPGRLAWMREQFGDELRIAPYLGTFFLAFNVARAPFADAPDLRRALSLVIDRRLLTERVLGAGELPAWGLIPPGMPGWEEAAAGPSQSLETRIAEARELYRRAGFDERRPLRTELRFNTSLTHRRLAVAIAAMWKQHLGVETRLVNEEWKVFVANRRHGRITEIVRGGWIADWRDAGNFLQLFQTGSPLNYAFFSDPGFDDDMDRAGRSSGAARLQWLRRAEDRLLDQAVVIPLYYYVSRHLVKPEVGGFKDNAMDIHLSRWLSLQ
ncbi:MAG: peptide ABC transporter substrate-binding protein [Wenzhouxiangella sp.]